MLFTYLFILACICFVKPDVVSLRDFNNHINPKISTKWYDLGLQLGIKDYTLDEIKHNHRDEARTCCRETIRRWLQNAGSAATWNNLIQALEADSISQKTLAKDIREKLLPGKCYLSTVSKRKVNCIYVCVPLL